MKRPFDFFVSMSALVFLSPILMIIWVLVQYKLGTPVLFKQKRPGLNGNPFTLYKFRSMTDARDKNGKLLPDYKRFTPFSNFLRKSSLDELPELFNVLRGEMSLVGPRPLLMQYLERYNAKQARRHNVKPGITGWAQINGRNTISWEEKFNLDIWYVDNLNFWLDLKIILLTIIYVFKRKGINQAGHVTVEEFKGSQNNE